MDDMKNFFLFLACLFFVLLSTVPAQYFHDDRPFTPADTLRGSLSPERTCYDLNFYHLTVKIDPRNHFISGKNRISFTVLHSFQTLQIDLFENMKIEKIIFRDDSLEFKREFNTVFVHFPQELVQGQQDSIVVYFSGTPQVSHNPPWNGGFIWEQDSSGNPWVAVTCQGTGASLWWPNKDQQADEPDSVLLSVIVPPGLADVSNGRLRRVVPKENGWNQYDWFVSYPINNYDLTVNIGKFAHFSDLFHGENEVTLDYYVLPENLEKAKKQFRQVKPMLRCFENYFGAYPFPRDGYKLIESPHLGMEHQSAVAYGEKYRNGYRGSSPTPIGLRFDFIIVHESAHEWWGNSLTSKDLADMWIHESFAAYAEALYVECRWGYEDAMEYLKGKKQEVKNDRPIIGPYGVNKSGSGDMYAKGALMLNTLRHVVNDDNKWFSILRGLAQNFKYQTIDASDVFNFINNRCGKDYTRFFDQYLKHKNLPLLEVKLAQGKKDLTCSYRWKSDVTGFDMPIKVTTAKNKFSFIYPTASFQKMQLKDMKPDDFRIAEKQFFVDVEIKKRYLLNGTE